MANKTNKTKNTNASASAFGWDFQTNAAILLMLENITSAKSIKVEGQTEDIEITLDNGNIIYSQAKSLEDIDSTSNLLKKLKDGIKTLNNAYNQGNAESLIYITNHSNPFNDKASIQYFLGRTKLPYNDLPKKCKEKLLNIIDKNNYSIDKEKLKIYILPFHGSDKDNRNKAIKEAVEDFLDHLGIRTSYTPKRILEVWQNEFFHNSTIPDSTIQIKKKEMVWPLIVEVCNFEQNDIVLSGCDAAMLDEIERQYSMTISNKSEDFIFFNKVLNDYNEYEKLLTTSERTTKFVNEEYVKYENEFDIGKIDTAIKHCLIKVIINKIIHRRIIIDKIKKGACLCD